MDSVFGKIIGLYNEKTLRVVYNTLLLLDDETNTENKEHYINSLSNFLMPVNNNVRVWIQENLVF